MERVLLSVIVPMYNEEEVIPETYKRLKRYWMVLKKHTRLFLSMTEAVIKQEKCCLKYVKGSNCQAHRFCP